MLGRSEARASTSVRPVGFTLVEVIVAIAILGLMAAMSGLTLTTVTPSREAAERRELTRARAEAIRTGRRVVAATNAHDTVRIVFLPDGRALGPDVDPLTGRLRDSVR
jgi:prepilin-type N-terminal cleavage/methylation domain-containing protein